MLVLLLQLTWRLFEKAYQYVRRIFVVVVVDPDQSYRCAGFSREIEAKATAPHPVQFLEHHAIFSTSVPKSRDQVALISMPHFLIPRQDFSGVSFPLARSHTRLLQDRKSRIYWAFRRPRSELVQPRDSPDAPDFRVYF